MPVRSTILLDTVQSLVSTRMAESNEADACSMLSCQAEGLLDPLLKIEMPLVRVLADM